MRHLTVEQRYTCCNEKLCYKQKDIALAIEKDESIVCRELKRNYDKRNGHYNCDLVQRKYDQRQKEKPKHIKFTNELESFVNSWLVMDFSPEQIAGRTKLTNATSSGIFKPKDAIHSIAITPILLVANKTASAFRLVRFPSNSFCSLLILSFHKRYN